MSSVSSGRTVGGTCGSTISTTCTPEGRCTVKWYRGCGEGAGGSVDASVSQSPQRLGHL